MKHFVRSLKYLLFLCVLYVGLVWLISLTDPSAGSVQVQLMAQLTSGNGVWMIVAFVALAAFYPLFGFMRSRIEGFEAERDTVRLDNAMQLYGFKLVEQHDGVRVYRATSFLRRLMLMFEDRIEVRERDGGIELVGIRRMVSRIAYQLSAYLRNSRFED